jgi:orotidine-5'-phosphate decarboxylase
MTTALETLTAAQRSTGSLLSAGLEPAARYLPPSFEPSIEDHERFLRLLIDATADRVCAYKANLAFFEALGPEGWSLLHRIRDAVPRNRLFIADAKRSDIGSSAERYAEAIYDRLGADACTVNPLMGADTLEPFLARADRLTLVLALTSNPGAADLLLPGDLWKRIIGMTLAAAGATPVGFVVGATRGETVAGARAAAPGSVFLVPGLGAQGGDLAGTLRAGSASAGDLRLILHLTRGLLPGEDDADPRAAIAARAEAWNRRVADALASSEAGA